MARLLVIDNYDSFTYNLVQMFRQYPLAVDVQRGDAVDLAAVEARRPDYLLVSPGPRDPTHAGRSIALIQRFAGRVPLLGVCLGMQCLNEAFGGRTVRAPVPTHGKTTAVLHDGQGLFSGLPAPFRAARYHSLMVAEVPPDLVVTGRCTDGVIMGLSHRCWPLHGVQFHPESFMTAHGFGIVENFLRLGPLSAALPCSAQRLEAADPWSARGDCPEVTHAG
jgi:anthranilate synthase component 2